MTFVSSTSNLTRHLRRHPRIALLLAAIVAVAVYFFWPAKKANDAESFGVWGGPVPVRLVEAKREALDVELTALGTVTPLNTVTVRSRVDGELMKVVFEEGQVVEAGTLLAQIDPRSFEVALAEAEGQQQQNLALLKNAEANLAMYADLFKQDSIAKQQLDNQEALVRQYRGTLKIDQARVDNARLQLSYTQIKAPIKGRLGLRKVDPGNLIDSSNTDGLVTITQMNPIGVLFKLPEADLPAVLDALRTNKKLVVEAWNRAGAERLASGTLRTVDNQIDTTTGTVSLKAVFANGGANAEGAKDTGANNGAALFPNQFVNVRLRVNTLNNAVVLPTAAVQHGSLGTFVYVVRPALAPVDNDKEREADEKPKPRATVRKVDLGPSNGMHTAITRGLEAGEHVVIEGLDALREGTEVVVIEDNASTLGSSAPAAVGTGA